MPRQGRRRKKRRTEKDVDVSQREVKYTPRCFVIKRGPVGDRVRDLVRDFRAVMLPNSAKTLRESRMNRLEDFIAVAGHFRVSHIVIFTVTKAATYMKLAKLPQGPTLTFKVDSFSLVHDVRAAQRRPRSGARDYTVAPLQVLGGFGGAASAGAEKQLMADMLRGMFPPVDVASFNQAECRRVALFHFDAEADVVQFRHFHVTQQQVGLQRGVSKLLRTRRIPKLGQRDDIADFVLGGGGGASESELDEAAEAPTMGGGKIGVRLTEVGPRLKLQLVKAEEGVCSGTVLYHRYQKRTPTQQEVNEAKARQRRKLKERDEKLMAMAGNRKAKEKQLKDRKKLREKAQEEAREDADRGPPSERRVETAPQAGGQPGKKRFHPFAWGSKAAKPNAKGQGKAVDVKRAGGAGTLAKGASPGPRGGGGGRAGQRTLDRFHQAQKRQRTS